MKRLVTFFLITFCYLAVIAQIDGNVSISTTEILIPSNEKITLEVTVTNNEAVEWNNVELYPIVPTNLFGADIFTVVDGSGELLETPISNTISEGIKTPLGVG
jgi:hypothetical protein